MAQLHEKLKEKFGAKIIETHAHRGDETAIIGPESLLEIAKFLKSDPAFAMEVLMDLTAVDGIEMDWRPRFEVVYHFYSHSLKHRLRLKVRVDEKNLHVPTLSNLWPIANWFEREVWDLFGIKFDGHPNLKRILLYEEFAGHPLRKDYPYNKRQPLIGPK